MRTYQQTLTAGETVTLTVNGNFFALIEAAGAVNLAFQYIGAAGSGGLTEIANGMQAGYSETFPGMLTAVSVTSSIDQIVVYGCGYGTARFDRTSITSQQATASANSAYTLTATDTPEEVLTADATRRRLILTAHPDNTGTVLLGGPSLDGSGSNAARRLDAGDSWIDETAAAAAVWAAGAAGDVICVEVAT
jgi:hypothetical protein